MSKELEKIKNIIEERILLNTALIKNTKDPTDRYGFRCENTALEFVLMLMDDDNNE